MRGMKLLLVVALLVAVRAQAAVYGDFVVPSGLSSSPQGAAITNRTAVSVPLQGGTMVVYFSLVPEFTDTPLRSIAASVGNASSAVAMSLGGRPWFGVQRNVAGMGNYFEGYTHRNGMVYGVDIDLGPRARPDAEIRQAFDRIWLFPGLTGMASGTVAAAVDQLDRGDAESVLAVLNAAPPQDTGNWAAMLLRAMAEEMTGDLTAATGSYASAAAMVQGAAEMSARAAGAAALAGTDDEAMSDLASLAASAPEEPVVWQELGKVSLAQGNLTAAQGYFNQAADVNPADESALYNLAFIHAQNGDYAGALRRGRELMHYFPWVPNGAIPDVTSAPGMDESRINMIMTEPLPLGNLGAYGAIAAQPLDYAEAENIIQVIQVPATTPVYQPTYGPNWSYVPVVLFDWMWTIGGHRPWWSSGHRPRPPGNWHPGGPGIRPPRPPGIRPPHFPERPGEGGNRPRPPEGGGRPPEGGGTRPPGGGGIRPPEGGGGRPPEGGRPPSGITTLPAPWPNPGVTTLPAPVTPPTVVVPPRPTTRPTQPMVRPAPVTPPTAVLPSRPTTRPSPSMRPTTRPAPETSFRPTRPSPGFAQPGGVMRPSTRPAPTPSINRPMTRPSPAGPQPGRPDRSALRR